MPRYKLTIEYCGTGFVGWQRQSNGRGIQQALEEAIQKLDAGVDKVTAAGRTDAGVHATGQIAHVDMVQDWGGFELAKAINYHIGRERIAILNVERVADDFHARFDARARHYLYRIINRRAPLALEEGLAWKIAYALDIDAMRAGAAHLIGHHDFTTFRSIHCQAASPVKSLDAIDITVAGDNIDISVRARSFLHNQVRSIVGTLERVGKGKWASDRVREALQAKDRTTCGPVAPACGLYLQRVIYPESDKGEQNAVEGS